MQVVSLRARSIDASGLGMFAKPLVWHLELDTSIINSLNYVDLQAFTQLEILKLVRLTRRKDIDCLQTFEKAPIFDMDLDLLDLQKLRALHIDTWSPKSSSVTAGGGVHAEWRPPLGGREWLLSPCWQVPGTALASLKVNAKISALTDNHTHAIQSILECQTGLELLRVASATLGSKNMPLAFQIKSIERRETPLRVEICTAHGCWIDESIYPSRTLVIKTDGPVYGRGQDAPNQLRRLISSMSLQ